jgi:hypothetical protein
MSGRPLTEDQISQGLRAHLPKRAQDGLHERVLLVVDTTAQQRALPSVLGALWDADPPARRRNLLVAAALLIALTIAAAAAAGAWRPQRDVVPDLSLLPPVDLQALPSPSLRAPSARPTPSAVTSPTGVWIATGTMGMPRDRYTAVRLLDGRVLVVGGSDDERDTSAELYDPATGTWSPTGNMLRPHQGFPATLLRDGRVLVGDVDDPDPAADDDEIAGAEVYDPASGTWTATGKMVNGGESTATLLRDGKVLVIGYNDTGEVYDPDRGTWAATGTMVNPRHSHAAILLPDGKVLVAGGHAPGDEPTDSAELYDQDTGAWTAIASMHAPRDSIEAFLRPDGKVLVLGQSHRDGPTPAEIYDPATGTWTATGDVARPGISVDASATMLSDGRVLTTDAPGDDPDSPPYAELYDPVAGSWTTTAPMLRSHGTPAILLLDGTVLVAGGHDCQDGVCVATGSAELYVPQGVSPPPLPSFPSPPPPVIPSPTPSPTPYPPAVGPVPSGARPWRVTVVNDSSKPTTLFLAEEDESGLARLCGSVLPSVVPPGATVKVTFLLPPKGVKTCWIWVNPVPGGGGSLFQTSDAPLKGEIFIMADGQGGWLGR